jgi:hypothetical protein
MSEPQVWLRGPIASVAPLAAVCAVVLIGCGSGSPAAPDPGATTIIATGPQVLRVSIQTPCAQTSRDFLAMTYTRVTVARSGSDWIATASSAAAGDVALRFHQSSSQVLANSFPVAGTIRGTGIHMPELIQAPAWDARANFGTDGRTVLTGVAFGAGFAGAQTGGLDGQGTGSIVVSDTAGHSCSGSAFSWSVFPPQTF